MKSTILQPQLHFVLFTKNEELSILKVIADLKKTISTLNLNSSKIIVMDDSQDSTPEIAQAAGATVLKGEKKGLGKAFFQAVKFCFRDGADVIVTLDGDGQVASYEVEKFLKTLEESGADLVIGSRFLERSLIKYKYPKANRYGVKVLSMYLSFMTGQRITDSHGGIRAMRSEVARDLEMFGSHTYVQESILDARFKGYKIVEIPSQWEPRLHGSSRVVRSIPKYVRKTLPVLIRKSFQMWLKPHRTPR
jgi:glycosyltransferase involved in cell wall biosynthesis